MKIKFFDVRKSTKRNQTDFHIDLQDKYEDEEDMVTLIMNIGENNMKSTLISTEIRNKCKDTNVDNVISKTLQPGESLFWDTYETCHSEPIDREETAVFIIMDIAITKTNYTTMTPSEQIADIFNNKITQIELKEPPLALFDKISKYREMMNEDPAIRGDEDYYAGNEDDDEDDEDEDK